MTYSIGFLKKNVTTYKLSKLLKIFDSINIAAKIKM
jgi:hypothetical protein